MDTNLGRSRAQITWEEELLLGVSIDLYQVDQAEGKDDCDSDNCGLIGWLGIHQNLSRLKDHASLKERGLKTRGL